MERNGGLRLLGLVLTGGALLLAGLLVRRWTMRVEPPERAGGPALAAVSGQLPAALPIAHRLAETVVDLLRTLERFEGVLGASLIDREAGRRCAAVDWDAICSRLSLADARRAARNCRQLLSATDETLARARFAATTMPGLSVASLRQRISSEGFRLSSLLRQLHLNRCAVSTRTAAEEPVTLTLFDGGRRVLVEPDRGLDPGRWYAIVLRHGDGARVTPSLGGASLPDAPFFTAARALAAQLGREAEGRPGWSALPLFSVTLPTPAETAPRWPPPLRLVPTVGPSGHPDTFQPRPVGGVPHQQTAAPAARACPAPAEAAPDILAPDRADAVAEVHRGVLPAEPAAGRPDRVPFLVAVPRGRATGVVILVHSLHSSARLFLDAVANDLARRRLASVALDLPRHGERLEAGAPLSDPADPAAFGAHLEQAERDVLALADHLRRCAAGTGLAPALTADHLGYFGYSLGASVGLLALAADDGLWPAVLAAPAGNIFRWQSLLTARHVGLLERVCVGEMAGGTCSADSQCVGGTACEHHPGIWLLGPALGPPYQRLVGDSDPMAATAALRAPADSRPLLVQQASNDDIVFPAIARRVADALGLTAVAAGTPLPRRALRVWPGDHGFVFEAAVRAEAAAFLARP